MNENRTDLILSKLKENKFIAVLLVVVVVISGISSFTESVDKLVIYAQKSYSAVTSDDKSSINYLSELVYSIKNVQDGDYGASYKKLHQYLINNEVGIDVISGAMEWNQDLYAKKIGSIVVIITTNQYKMPAFALFFNANTGELILSDNELGLGVMDVKTIEKTGASPSSLLIIRYISISGTGTFGSSVKFYTIDSDLVLLSLDKPYSEINSGWSAFKADTVEFKTKNDILVKNGVMEIHTTGVVIVGEKNVEYRKLPEEVYIWNPNSRQFDQTIGRITHKEGLMTHIYSDIAEPTGDWFTKPRIISSKEQDLFFVEEQW